MIIRLVGSLVAARGRAVVQPAHYQQFNCDHARLRTPGERAFTLLKPWHILRQARCSTNRISRIIKAIHTLLTCTYQG
ncbi:hypothetical protein [Streptomyces sp. NPDC055709]